MTGELIRLPTAVCRGPITPAMQTTMRQLWPACERIDEDTAWRAFREVTGFLRGTDPLDVPPPFHDVLSDLFAFGVLLGVDAQRRLFARAPDLHSAKIGHLAVVACTPGWPFDERPEQGS